MLVPFTGGELDPVVLDAAIRIARAEEATLVPAYLIVMPLEYRLDAPLQHEVAVAMPLLEAVEHAALRAGLPVDARVETGPHAHPRAPAALGGRAVRPHRRPGSGRRGDDGFTPKELQWILVHAPTETRHPAARPHPRRGRSARPDARRRR